MQMEPKKISLAVWKFSSCDGCQLSLLDCEDEILAIAEKVDIAYFMEATSTVKDGPYDLSLVEGSVTTKDEIERIKEVRKLSKYVVTIGACATSGGIQALRNFHDVKNYINIVYAKPEYISTLKTSKPISDYVKVDFELRGCPVNKYQLIEVCKSFLFNKKPPIASTSVCTECKARGNPCIMVSHGIPCLGPITHAGCNAICPSYNRGCYGCYGPKETANAESIASWFKNKMNVPDKQILRILRSFNANADPLKKVSKDYE